MEEGKKRGRREGRKESRQEDRLEVFKKELSITLIHGCTQIYIPFSGTIAFKDNVFIHKPG